MAVEPLDCGTLLKLTKQVYFPLWSKEVTSTKSVFYYSVVGVSILCLIPSLSVSCEAVEPPNDILRKFYHITDQKKFSSLGDCYLCVVFI